MSRKKGTETKDYIYDDDSHERNPTVRQSVGKVDTIYIEIDNIRNSLM